MAVIVCQQDPVAAITEAAVALEKRTQWACWLARLLLQADYSVACGGTVGSVADCHSASPILPPFFFIRGYGDDAIRAG